VGHPFVICDIHRKEILKVDASGTVTWRYPGPRVHDFWVLKNGNTVLCNWGGHGHVGKQTQIIEITPDKEVVWNVFRNNVFATPLHIQLLDVEGDPAQGELCR